MEGNIDIEERLCSNLSDLDSAFRLSASILEILGRMEEADVEIEDSPIILRSVSWGEGDPINLRPINSSLFIDGPNAFQEVASEFRVLLGDLRESEGDLDPARMDGARETGLISRALYTTVQAIGVGMDIFVSSNRARKNFGTRFEEVTESVFHELGIGHSSLNLSLAYGDPDAEAVFRNQVDLVIAKEAPISSTSGHLDPDEVVVSIKTSSKDRFAKIFLDKKVLHEVTNQEIPVLALFHNDIQRSGQAGISHTFVAGNFLAYVDSLGPLNGVYYIDPPPQIHLEPWNQYLKTFDDLILSDLWNLVF